MAEIELSYSEMITPGSNISVHFPQAENFVAIHNKTIERFKFAFTRFEREWKYLIVTYSKSDTDVHLYFGADPTMIDFKFYSFLQDGDIHISPCIDDKDMMEYWQSNDQNRKNVIKRRTTLGCKLESRKDEWYFGFVGKNFDELALFYDNKAVDTGNVTISPKRVEKFENTKSIGSFMKKTKNRYTLIRTWDSKEYHAFGYLYRVIVNIAGPEPVCVPPYLENDDCVEYKIYSPVKFNKEKFKESRVLSR
jgi:hypothetical protein